MKNINLLFIIILPAWLFLSCSDNPVEDDDTGKNSEYYEVNKWIEKTMRDYYYWYDEIPRNVNYGYNPNAFFVSLLSKKDGKPYTNSNGHTSHYYYSTIESTASITRAATSGKDLSLGFEYQYYYITNLKKNALKVLYILPGSPASKSELKRGDWIFTVNGKAVSDEVVANINDGSSKILGIAEGRSGQVSKQITLSPANVEDNPVYFANTYRLEGKNIGYLIYNHFTAGKNDDDETYNNDLRKVFTDFKNNSLDEFILDLRYNRGGVINCAQLLATLLAPSQALGDVFCHVTYNNKKSSQNYTYKFDTRYMQQGGYGANLNPKRLFIITSNMTASASEAVINGLHPFFSDNIILIGEQTEGKNVGSITLTESKYDWKLHPIVCEISNKNYESDYEDGFYPTPFFECTDVHENIYDLGNVNEYMLNKVLRYILYNEPVSSRIRSLDASDTADAGLIPISSSLDRKATNGVLIK